MSLAVDGEPVAEDAVGVEWGYDAWTWLRPGLAGPFGHVCENSVVAGGEVVGVVSSESERDVERVVGVAYHADVGLFGAGPEVFGGRPAARGKSGSPRGRLSRCLRCETLKKGARFLRVGALIPRQPARACHQETSVAGRQVTGGQWAIGGVFFPVSICVFLLE